MVLPENHRTHNLLTVHQARLIERMIQNHTDVFVPIVMSGLSKNLFINKGTMYLEAIYSQENTGEHEKRNRYRSLIFN